MSAGSEELVLDRLIHEPARLAILTALSSVKAADFVFLQASHRADAGQPVEPPDETRGGRPDPHREDLRQQATEHQRRLDSDRQKERIATHGEQLDRLKHRAETPSGA